MLTVVDSHNLNARLLRFRSDAEQEDPCALAEDLIAAQRYGDARGVAVSAQTDDGPLDARLLVIEGRAWLLDRDLVRAQAALVKAAKRDPGSFDAYRWLGQVLLERGDPVRAERALERAQAVVPGDAEVQRMLLLAHGRVDAMSAPPPPMPSITAAPHAVAPAVVEPRRAPAPVVAARVPAPALPPTEPGVRRSVTRAGASPSPVDMPAPARTASPVGLPSPVGAPSPVDMSSPVGLSSPVGMPSPVGVPAEARSVPGTRTAPGSRTALDTRSAPGSPRAMLDEPLREREDDTTNSFQLEPMEPLEPEFDDMSEGALDAPAADSFAGGVSAPASRANHATSGAGRLASPTAAAAPRATPVGVSAPGARSSAGGYASPAPSTAGTVHATTPLGLGATHAAPVSAFGRPSPLPPPAPGFFDLAALQGAASGRGNTAAGSESARFGTSPGAATSPGASTSPGTSTSPGVSSPGARNAPGTLGGARSPIPARTSPGSSASGTLSSPPRMPSAAGAPSPLPPPSGSFGGTSSPGTRTSPGTLTSSSSPGRIPSLAGPPLPHASTASGLSSPGAFWSPAADGDSDDDAVDVDVEVRSSDRPPANVAFDTAPGLGTPPGPVAPPGMWDGHSVMAAWPSEDPLVADDTGAVRTLGADDSDRPEPGEPFAPAADLALGKRAGEPDDPARVVEMLAAHGLIEPPQAEAPVWPARADVPATGTPMRGAMTAAWITTLVLCAGGWFGWQQWVSHRHAEARALVVQARKAAWTGDYAALVDAERALRKARELHPRSTEVPTLELFVQAVRVVENGNREPSGLRAALARGDRLGADTAYLSVARALLAAYTGAAAELATLLPPAQKATSKAPELAYLVGRLEQRLGQPAAQERLQAVTIAEPELVPATLALAESDHERGDDQAAIARLDSVLALHADHLRAQLFRAVLRADADDPATSLKQLEALAKQARAGAPVDRILWGLARARVLRRQGDATAAGLALREALAAGTSEAGLLALVAQEALRAGELGSAQHAASGAVAVSPSVAAYRVLLARVLLARGDGQRVLELTSTLPPGDPTPELLAMRARAALQTGQPEALSAALAALPDSKSDVGVEQSALRVRLRAAIEPSSRLLGEAQSLLRRAPGDPEALRAVAEVALALRSANEARSAAEQLAKLLPDDPEAHHWLGRARRMAGDAAGAEQSLRRALELSPGFGAALSTLASLLLDAGKYQEADAAFQELATRQVVTGRVGRAEALLGVGRAEDAAVQISGLSDAQRALPAVREIEARVLLAQGKPGDAVAALRPLLEGENVRPSALVLQGAALYAIDEVDAAAGAYDAALERDGMLPEALLGRAEVHLRAERPKDALELLAQAGESLKARLRPPVMHARYLTLLGRAHVQREKRENLEAGKEALRRAVQMPEAPAEAHFWLGEALGGRKTPEAAAAFKRYLELDPNGAYAVRAKRALGPLL